LAGVYFAVTVTRRMWAYLFIYLFMYLFIRLFVYLFSYAQLSNSNSITDSSNALARFSTRASELVIWKHEPYVQWISEAVKQPERETYY
jgi:hypothetical protein